MEKIREDISKIEDKMETKEEAEKKHSALLDMVETKDEEAKQRHSALAEEIKNIKDIVKILADRQNGR